MAKPGDIRKEFGYILRYLPEHPRARPRGYVPDHILIAEKALGKFLPVGSVVHHLNGIKSENSGNNLVVCQDERYHQLLHLRMKRKEKYGNFSVKKCKKCCAIKHLSQFPPNLKAIDRHHHICLACPPVKPRPNSKKTHCKNGHEFTEINTIITPKGSQRCKKCANVSTIASRRRRHDRSGIW